MKLLTNQKHSIMLIKISISKIIQKIKRYIPIALMKTILPLLPDLP